MITHKEIESLGWQRGSMATSHYSPNYFLKGSPERKDYGTKTGDTMTGDLTIDDCLHLDEPSGVWMTKIGEDFRIVKMFNRINKWHEVLFMGRLETIYDLAAVMRLIRVNDIED